MNTLVFPVALALLGISLAAPGLTAETHPEAPADKPSVQNLITKELTAIPGTTVILSHVVLPPNAGLATHWHPGEEFGYVLDGSLWVSLDGAEEVELTQGDYGTVPYKLVHSIRAGENGATLIVFRVHETGEPELVMVE